jgi:hypothetical protein
MIRLEGLLPDSFLVLDTIRNWIYHFLVMGRIDFELNGRKNTSPKKRKILLLSNGHN